MERLSLKCFGVGDGTAAADRNHSAYLYDFGGKPTLLTDCGEPVSRSLKASGAGPDAVDHILISHLHSDHIGGFFMLIQGLWIEQRRKDLSVHMPAEGIGPFRRMLDTVYMFEEVLPFRLTFKPWHAGQSVPLGEVRVTPYRTTHLDSLKKSVQVQHPGEFAAYCFLLESGAVRIGHSADLGAPEDLEPLLARPLDLLVCELAHFKPEELFRYLHGRAIRQIAFTHLGRVYWERLDETRRLAAELLPGVNFSFPHDQDVITL